MIFLGTSTYVLQQIIHLNEQNVISECVMFGDKSTLRSLWLVDYSNCGKSRRFFRSIPTVSLINDQMKWGGQRKTSNACM